MPPTCPGCGDELRPIVVNGPHPPWSCQNCQRAWWNAELAQRDAYDPVQRSFRADRWAIVSAEAQLEQLTAGIRGTSVTIEMVPIIAQSMLDKIVPNLPPNSAIREAIAKKKAGR